MILENPWIQARDNLSGVYLDCRMGDLCSESNNGKKRTFSLLKIDNCTKIKLYKIRKFDIHGGIFSFENNKIYQFSEIIKNINGEEESRSPLLPANVNFQKINYHIFFDL